MDLLGYMSVSGSNRVVRDGKHRFDLETQTTGKSAFCIFRSSSESCLSLLIIIKISTPMPSILGQYCAPAMLRYSLLEKHASYSCECTFSSLSGLVQGNNGVGQKATIGKASSQGDSEAGWLENFGWHDRLWFGWEIRTSTRIGCNGQGRGCRSGTAINTWKAQSNGPQFFSRWTDSKHRGLSVLAGDWLCELILNLKSGYKLVWEKVGLIGSKIDKYSLTMNIYAVCMSSLAKFSQQGSLRLQELIINHLL